MSDLTSKDSLYYTISQYNESANTQLADKNENLIYPLIQNASDYQVSVSKARVDLSSIPLTTHNIPLKTYQVGIRNGNDEYTATYACYGELQISPNYHGHLKDLT